MALTTRAPRAAAAAVAAPAEERTPASGASQALVAGAFAIAFGALAARMGSPLWCAAPTAALVGGIVLGLQLDLRSRFARVHGVLAGMATLVVLSVLWVVAQSWLHLEVPYAVAPLAALVVFGADWSWVQRLRPSAVLSGLVLVPLVAHDGRTSLPLALAWFAVTAGALWSLRRDALQAVPTPVPLVGPSTPEPEAGAGRVAVAVVVSWLVAGAVVALVSLVPQWFESPEAEGRLGSSDAFGGSGTPAGDSDAGGDIGPGGEVPGEIDEAIEDRDVNGDGIADRDIDGDGKLDPDLDGDGIPDIDADGDGVPDDTAPVSTVEPGGSLPVPDGSVVPDDTDPPTTSADDTALARIVGIAVVALLVVALIAVALRALARERARRQALAARPWAVRLAERLDREGELRGRARGRDEPVTAYADALAGDVLPHDRLAEVGAALSTALFGARAPSDATGAWVAQVIDEAVTATPAPTWWDDLRARRPRRAS